MIINLKTSANAKDVLDEVRSSIGRTVLPVDAKSPVITEVKTDTGRAFSVFIYDPSGEASKSVLVTRAIELQKVVE